MDHHIANRIEMFCFKDWIRYLSGKAGFTRGIFFSFFLLFSAVPVMCQVESVDSLNRELYLTLDQDKQTTILNQIAYKLRDTDPVNSMKYVEEALNQARNLDNRKEVATALATKGYLLTVQNEYTAALICYLESIDIFKELEKEDKEVAFLHYRIAMIYKTLGSYDKALEQSLDGLRVYESVGDDSGIALIYRVLGSVYKYKGEYEKSLHYYYSGLQINEKIQDDQGVANSYNNIGIVYLLMGNHEKALEYYRMSLSINNASRNESEASINLGNIGTVYLDMNILDSAWHYINLRYESAVKLNNKRIIATTYHSYGDFYLKKADYNKSYDFYIKSLNLARELGVLETCKENLLSISKLKEMQSDHETAFNYYRLYINLRDSLFNTETMQRFDQMELDYSYEKEKDALLVRQQKTKLYIIMGFGASLLSIFLLVLIYMNQRIKLKKNDLAQKGLELEKQQLQFEVESKDREMFSKAVNLIDKTEIINSITRQLSRIIIESPGNSKPIKQIIKDLEFHASTKIWDEFEYTFLKVHPGFFEKLDSSFPGLTPNEKRLCAFIKLNLTTKDIASITRKTNHSLTVARTRLRKKLGLSNTGGSLSAFLSRF
ncbi:MAG: tetratricopeptide repeat protein [Bacteroidales bacterium]|nr:tetratricopeptide repeat protein [Bacteroidales bacterium]